jgi:hypothetical protein
MALATLVKIPTTAPPAAAPTKTLFLIDARSLREYVIT